MNVLAVIIGLATGIISGCGVGGGSLLVLYLTAVIGMEQYAAGGVNLLYFIGCAPAALIGHIRQRNVVWKATLLCSVAGIASAVPASLLASGMDATWLRRAFGFVLLYVGIKELRKGFTSK